MKSIRNKFIKDFSEDEAVALEAAAERHGNGVNNENTGSDKFKWVLLIVIGHQCVELKNYAEFHDIKTSWDKLKPWIKKNASLESRDGDLDYISLAAGIYDEYVKEAK